MCSHKEHAGKGGLPTSHWLGNDGISRHNICVWAPGSPEDMKRLPSAWRQSVRSKRFFGHFFECLFIKPYFKKSEMHGDLPPGGVVSASSADAGRYTR